MPVLTAGSLFSGIGGFDLGFEIAGMEILWQVEIDPKCDQILRRHYPTVNRQGDIRHVGKGTLEKVDVICGGFPCQDLSVAGKRAGLAGERSGLWFEFIRVVGELKPKWVVVENVPGLLSSHRGRDFAVILQGLAQCGYDAWWRVLDAQYFGVAQRRRRVFIIGHLGKGRAAEVLFEREGVSWDPPPSRETRKEDPTYAPTSFGGYSKSQPTLRKSGGDLGGGSEGLIAYTVHGEYSTAMTGKGDAKVAFETDRARSLDSNGGYATNQGGNIIAFGGTFSGPVFLSTSLNTKDRYDLESETVIAIQHSIIGRKPEAGAQGKGHRDDGATWTLDGRGDADAVAGSFGVRRLTPTECERLQGFPDGWTECGVDPHGNRVDQSDSARYRQLGNAVCVPVADWIGRGIISAQEQTLKHS